jgi:hypothetical protein
MSDEIRRNRKLRNCDARRHEHDFVLKVTAIGSKSGKFLPGTKNRSAPAPRTPLVYPVLQRRPDTSLSEQGFAATAGCSGRWAHSPDTDFRQGQEDEDRFWLKDG